MKRITYYLGAGASFYSMPLLDGIETRLKIYEDFIFHKKKLLPSETDRYLIELKHLIENIKESTSIDNYANELYNNNRNLELKKLKHIVSGFFLFEQLKKDHDLYSQEIDYDSPVPHWYMPYPEEVNKMVRDQFDKRYRTFFNNFFTQTTDILPPHINIISWNYDLQLEGSYCRAKSNCSLDIAQTKLNVNPSPNYRKSENVSEIIKLNGTAGVLVDDNFKYSNHIQKFTENIIEVVKNNIQTFSLIHYSTPYSLSFAFEHKNNVDERKKRAQEIIEQTDVLIIIGYSFPKMNNEVDKFILGDTSNISRSYIQVRENDFKNVIRNIKRFDSSFADEIELIDDLFEFYIP